MKKLLLLFSFVCTMQLNAQTNVYHPFPDSSALWNETSYIQCCGTIGFTPQIEFFGGDTIISTIHYKKVLANGYQTGGGMTCCNYINKYLGAMRQDTTSKKVYFCAAGTTNDKLLYDFDLHVGDTLQTSYISQPNSNYVSKIDSILIGTKYRKQYYLTCNYSTCSGSINYVSLIEGIGSTFGLLYQLAPPFEGGSDLNCFSQNGVTLYPVGTDSCSSTVSIKGFKNNLSLNFTIYPNPAQNNFTIETDNTEKQTLQVFDVNGKLVLTQALSGITNVDVSTLAKGVYNVSITNNNTVLNKRLVVVK